MQRRLARTSRARAVLIPVFATIAAVTVGAVAASTFAFGLSLTDITTGPLGLPVAWGAPNAALWIATIAALLAIALTSILMETVDVLTERRQPPSDLGTRTITVVIPAHNEAGPLGACLESLRRQHLAVDRILVIADACSDDTAEVARAAGVDVQVTVDNTGRKAGALNQALDTLLDQLAPSDLVLVMDADTMLDDGYLDAALTAFALDPELAAVGGIFLGDERPGLLAQLQRNEFHRYARHVRTRAGRVFVLTGTASAFRVDALRAIAAARGVELPGPAGRVYDPDAITEDNELTLALRSLGARMTSPAGCIARTEVMPDLGALWTQRCRWMRGALENVGSYGLRPAVWRYWVQQFGLTYATIALTSALAVLFIAPILVGWVWLPFWLAVGGAFIVERVVSVWGAGWKGRLLAAALIPELLYDLVLLAAHTASLASIALNRGDRWGHLDHGAAR